MRPKTMKMTAEAHNRRIFATQGVTSANDSDIERALYLIHAFNKRHL